MLARVRHFTSDIPNPGGYEDVWAVVPSVVVVVAAVVVIIALVTRAVALTAVVFTAVCCDELLVL